MELELQQMALSVYLHTALEKPEIALGGRDCYNLMGLNLEERAFHAGERRTRGGISERSAPPVVCFPV